MKYILLPTLAALIALAGHLSYEDELAYAEYCKAQVEAQAWPSEVCDG